MGEELEKAWEPYYEVQAHGYSPFATCGNDQCGSKDFCVITSAALPSTSPCSPLHAPFIPSTPEPQVLGVDFHAYECNRCEVASPQVEAIKARYGLVCLKRLLSRIDEN